MKISGEALTNNSTSQAVRKLVDGAAQNGSAKDADKDGDNESRESAAQARKESGGSVNVTA
ncbi:MAG: hypothetical protein HZA04_06070 [Nitrospinae bacterium]|nr:hypothetical protein [Nitrospinota bacterium]